MTEQSGSWESLTMDTDILSCFKRNSNRELRAEKESETQTGDEKKVKVRRKLRQKLVPTEEDEKSCHGHISCLQWIFFPTKHSSKSRATPQQQKTCQL